MVFIHNATQPEKGMNNAICTNIDGPRNYHTKLRKTEREKQILYDTTSTWNLKYDTNALIYETERLGEVENKFIVTKGGGG